MNVCYCRAVLEGIHVGYGDILIVVLISDDPHHLVVIPIIQEGHVLTEAQVSHNNIMNLLYMLSL